MFGLGGRSCRICGREARKGAFRVPGHRGAFVCGLCYGAWEHSGRTCAKCGTVVHGPQEVGAFLEQRTLGHADCGGLRMFAA